MLDSFHNQFGYLWIIIGSVCYQNFNSSSGWKISRVGFCSVQRVKSQLTINKDKIILIRESKGREREKGF